MDLDPLTLLAIVSIILVAAAILAFLLLAKRSAARRDANPRQRPWDRNRKE